MPVQHGADNSPLAFYWNIPPVTRSVVSILLATKLATVLGVFPIQLTYLSWTLVVKHLQASRTVCFASPRCSRQTVTRSCTPACTRQCYSCALLILGARADMAAYNQLHGPSSLRLRISHTHRLDVSVSFSALSGSLCKSDHLTRPLNACSAVIHHSSTSHFVSM